MPKRGAPGVRGVTSIAIPVRDQDTALKFYTEKMGFKVITDRPLEGMHRRIELLIPGAETRVALFTPSNESLIGQHQPITFWCDDLYSTFAALTSRGVSFSQEPKVEPWGLIAMWKDVDDNSFTLSSRRSFRSMRRASTKSCSAPVASPFDESIPNYEASAFRQPC